MEYFMRACLLALAAVAVAQPAFARDQSHKSSHQIARHHAQGHHGATLHRKHARVARVRSAPIISGYSIPQSFARTDAADTAFRPARPMTTQQVSGLAQPRIRPVRAAGRDSALDAMIARHAAANGLPADLVHRVVIRESRYNPRASNRGALGLMQIKHATARGVGYTGPASGLFDPETNLTYAVRYLAGAYRAAGGNANRAIAYYASGYHGRGLAARAPRVMLAEASVPYADMQPGPVTLRDTDVAIPADAPPQRRARR
jgi:soluble lytic murein transglycosylase-like protein